MSSDCLLHQVPSSASRFLKGIPAELLEHTCHMELLNKAPARRDTNGANFAQQPPRPPAAHAISRAGGASDARLASQAAAGGVASQAAGAAALAVGLGSQPVGSEPVGSQHAMREAISGSQAEGERPAGAVTGAVGAHLARWQQAHARKEHERRARKEKEQMRKAEKEAANDTAAGDGEASGSKAPRAPKAAPKAPSSKAAGKARVLPAGDQPPAKRAKSKRIVVDDEDSEDNDLFD